MPFKSGESGSVEHQFKKGQSGNPKGRPKLPDIREAIADILGEEKDGKTALEVILARWRQLAAAGNLKAGELLMQRGYGMPKEHKEITINKPVIIDWSEGEKDGQDSNNGGKETT